MSRRVCPTLLFGWLVAAPAWAGAAEQVPLQVPIGEAVERHLQSDETFAQWTIDSDRLAAQAGDRLETRDVVTETPETVKLADVVPPIHFESGVADIPPSTVDELRVILNGLHDRHNVRLHFVGHADNQPLSPTLVAKYGDNEGLSRERAGEVAEFLQRALELPPESISYEWAGAAQPVATNGSESGRAQNRRVEVQVWYDELKDKVAQEEFVVGDTIRQVKVCRTETVCKLRYLDGHAHRARVQNLVAPLHYDEAEIDVTPEFTAHIERTLQNLADKQNVVIKFIGYTDNAPLPERDERIYGTQESLSKARARRVALAVQEQLALPTQAIDSDGRGAARALSSNDTAQGRALNRRIEVEFWYDDPLQELPDEPQLCPTDAGAETVTGVYDPPWGEIAPLSLDQGQPIVPAGYLDNLKRALSAVADKERPRLRFVGYTGNKRLERRTAVIYGDDIGLSAARARRAMDTIAQQLALTPDQAEHEGRGFVQSKDVIATGFTQGETSYVAVEVVYDEHAVQEDFEGIEVTPLVRELEPENPLALNLMRITVDGKPIDDPGRSSADVQRCTDVAFQKADIQFGFNDLTSTPRLSVAASTAVAPLYEISPTVVIASPIRFQMYTNYRHFIERAEVRVFDAKQSSEATPLMVLEVGADDYAVWNPDGQRFNGPIRELKYLLRAYGQDGRFDETAFRPLWLTHSEKTAGALFAEAALAPAQPVGVATFANERPAAPEVLTGYGEDALAMQNIPLGNGTVHVRGTGIAPDKQVYVAGNAVPVDAGGNFVSEAILPEGKHTVEVAVLDKQGNGDLFLRDLELKRDDWFYVGMGDITWSQNNMSGPGDLLQGADAPYDYNSDLDGRLAFYVDGKFANQWGLTASVDTREDELGNLFSNFLNKSPDALFRRIDPDYHYPTYGDDSAVEQDAPTQGKLYLKVHRDEDYAVWGNYQVGFADNELAQVDRGLYGAKAHYQTQATTSFGEQRMKLDGFGAEPGTVPSRQEFRGTGGSLYFLRHQDILMGSERATIEIRDKASNIVTGVVHLRSATDYDIDYLQGTIMLAEPLSATVSDNLLVRGGAVGGDEAFLVVNYEFTPGFEDLDALSTGGQASAWINDHIMVGGLINDNSYGDYDSKLYAEDLTLRLTSATWLKVQGSHSEGLITRTLQSSDGGFGFQGIGDALLIDSSANGFRSDLSVGFADILRGAKGQMTLYTQDLEAGYSAPGLETLTDTKNYGGTLTLPVTNALQVHAKSDVRDQDEGLQTQAHELDVAYQLAEHWNVKAGVRNDERKSDSPVPLVLPTQQLGDRTDAVVQLGYDSKTRWNTYGFVQDTVSKSGDREDNGRIGVGGSYRVSDSLRIESEASDGDLGPGGKLGTTYMHSDRTTYYMNYALEDEGDDAMGAMRGSEGSLVSGVKMRFADSSSVYLEERYRHGNNISGLTHSTGANLAPTDRLSLAATTDIGKLEDFETGAETDRKAGGFRIGYGFDALQLSSGIEYRHDKSEQLDATWSKRETWLFRNSFKYQMNPSMRLLGKVNYSTSDSSLGTYYGGEYTQAVAGYAYRPVSNDRLNLLGKYTYFYNMPTTDQVTLTNTPAQYIQKSNVAALDVDYQLTPTWSLGGKYAYRLGQISLDRDNPDFFDNNAALYILRTDWRLWDNWEALVEGRLLDMTDLDEQRAGALVAFSRYLGEHFKVGLGYNFTDFSDDLTDLSYDDQGVFVNVTGAF
jgi:flagellar motor protein MotB